MDFLYNLAQSRSEEFWKYYRDRKHGYFENEMMNAEFRFALRMFGGLYELTSIYTPIAEHDSSPTPNN